MDIYTYIYRVIQEESALLWEMIVRMILSKKVHKNMGPILNGYRVMGIFYFPYTPSCEPRLQTSWRLVAYCLHCKHYFCQLTRPPSCNEQLAQFTTERQTVLRPAVTFSKTSFKHRSIQIKGNFTKLILHLYFKCIMYYAGLLFSSIHCQ